MDTTRESCEARAFASAMLGFAGRCLECGYRLRGLTKMRCPECGRPFDPRDPFTYAERDPPTLFDLFAGQKVRAWLLSVLCVFGPLALFAAFFAPSPSGHGYAKPNASRSLIGQNGPVALGIDLYRSNMGRLPVRLSELCETPSNATDAARWHGPYIDDPNTLKDAWQQDLMYLAPGKHNTGSYDLWSIGPDGLDGTDDDIGNWSR